jgi:hypothetical protein
MDDFKETHVPERKFHKTVFQIEVLSEDPVPESMGIDAVLREAIDGSYSMRVASVLAEELDAHQAAQALRVQGSDPGFFALTDLGEDLNAASPSRPH